MPRWAQFAIFLSITLAVYGGAHFYIYTRFASMLGLQPGGLLWALRVVLAFLALSFVASRLLLEWRLDIVTRSFYVAACVWMGLLLYLVLASVAAHAVGGLARVAGLWSDAPEAAARFGRLLAVAVVAAAGALSWAAWREASGPPRMTDIEATVKGGTPDLNGFTIVQLSDIHLGVIVDGGRLDRLVDMTNEAQPDLVVITGDLVDENADRIVGHFEPLSRLRPRFGVFAVTGNHEYYAGADAVIRQATEVGVRFLQNEKTTLPNGLILCGMNDPTAARMGLPAVPLETVAGDGPKRAPIVLLHHQPTVFEKAAALGVDLMLSGHTHHGQLWPLAQISRLFYSFQNGSYRIGAGQLWVTSGAGTWGPPMRLGAPPEIVRVRLRTAAGP